MTIVTRRTGRVLPVHEGRVLLLRGGDPGRANCQWWFTIGGGCVSGEPSAATVRREAWEEAGLILPDDLGSVVLRRETAFDFEGERLEQTEDYYLCRVSSKTVSTVGWAALERRTITAYHWWSLAELRETADVVHPAGLADLLTGLLAIPVTPADEPG